jgi:hypothetical protein
VSRRKRRVYYEIRHAEYLWWDIIGKRWKRPGDDSVKSKDGSTRVSNGRTFRGNYQNALRLFRREAAGAELHRIFWKRGRRVFISWVKV